MSKATAIRNLSVQHLSDKPLDVNWQDVAAATDDPWFYEAARCEECNAIVSTAGPGGNDRHDLYEDDCECRGHVPSCEGPMMDYAYPCDWDDGHEAAWALVDLPVVPVVLDGGRKALALTGGGMDFTWQICAAYIALGFLPPLHFASDLPRMSGAGGMHTRRVLQASLRSSQVAAGWARDASRRVREMQREYLGKPKRAKAAKRGGK